MADRVPNGPIPPPSQCVTCGQLNCYKGFDGVNTHRPSGSLHHPPPVYRLESDGEGFARLWDGDKVVALIVAHYDGWTARPGNVPGAKGYGWICPTRREAVASVTAWLNRAAT